jgi:hypothetical protein
MSAVNITNVAVLDNPTAFLNPFQFEISYECLVPLDDGMPPFYPSVPLFPIWLLGAWRRRRARVSFRRGPLGGAVFGSAEAEPPEAASGSVPFCCAPF